MVSFDKKIDCFFLKKRMNPCSELAEFCETVNCMERVESRNLQSKHCTFVWFRKKFFEFANL